MAKRLRNTKRWERPSFRRLTFEQKGVLQYLEDVCSSSGIWAGDFELASLQLGITLTEEKLQSLLGDLVWKIGPEAFFISTFFEEQYGSTKDTFNAKVAAIAELQSLGLMDEHGTITRPSPNSPPTVVRVSPDTPSKGKGIGKGNEGGVGETNATPPRVDSYHDLVASLFVAIRKHPPGDESIAATIGPHWAWISRSGVVSMIRSSKDDDWARKRFAGDLQAAHSRFLGEYREGLRA